MSIIFLGLCPRIVRCLVRSLWFNCYQENICCAIPDDYLHVFTPERLWRVSIEQPEQRQKMEAVLEDMEQTIRSDCFDHGIERLTFECSFRM